MGNCINIYIALHQSPGICLTAQHDAAALAVFAVPFQMTSFGGELQPGCVCSNPDSCRHMGFSGNTSTEFRLAVLFFVKAMSALSGVNLCLRDCGLHSDVFHQISELSSCDGKLLEAER